MINGKNKILQVLNNSKKKGALNDMVHIHHTLMKEYGWIPLEEFKQLPLQTINNLLAEINKDRKAQNKANKKMKQPRKG